MFNKYIERKPSPVKSNFNASKLLISLRERAREFPHGGGNIAREMVDGLTPVCWTKIFCL